MVKLDVSIFQFLCEEDFRVLSAIEMVIRNHELAPVPLIDRVANLSHGGTQRRLRELLKFKLIHHDRKLYDGYAMKYSGYDYLALHVFTRRGVLSGVGAMIGCGKESDIYSVCNDDGEEYVLKLQRLGRCSFRSVARNRQYTRSTERRGASWFYLSRLAASREFAYLTALYEEGYPVPKPVDHNRHAIVMEKINGTLLSHVDHLDNPAKLFHSCLKVLLQLAHAGLIHGDFNEFNLMIRKDTHELVVIDFPQMVSTQHPNAADLFDRDVRCIHNFFQKKFKLTFDYWPTLESEGIAMGVQSKLHDRITHLSGADAKEFEHLLEEQEGNEARESDGDSENETATDPEADGTTNDKKRSCASKKVVGMRDADKTPESEEDEASDFDGEEAASTTTSSRGQQGGEARPPASACIAVPMRTVIDIRQIRNRVKREKEKREFADVQRRSTRRNQFKTKDRREIGKAMKESREANSYCNDY